MEYAELVPQRLNVFAFIIFLGVVQGFFFAYFLLRKSNRSNPKNLYLGLFIFIYAAVLLEVFLCYSGLIVHTLWLVDYSESNNFLGGPILYFLIISYCGAELPKRKWLHYIPFIFYSAYMVFFFVQTTEFKFNAYIDAYFPDMPKIDSEEIIDPDPLGIKRYTNELGVLYAGIYMIFSLRVIYQSVTRKKLKLFKGTEKEMAWFRNLLLLCLVGYLFWFVKSFTCIRDVQDHIGAVIHTIVIYFVGFRILQQGFISPAKSVEKYAKSSLSSERKADILNKLDSLAENSDFFLDNNLTLAGLAGQIKVSHHHLSQTLNEELGKSYGEYINSLRIVHSQKLLVEQPNIKIEEIAEQAGFNSKSTFNTAFKKLTGQTPSQYRSERV